ncbi:hypothetical protein [Woeseia oceani]|nr:hypothetical protein [Woeseia oceani]
MRSDLLTASHYRLHRAAHRRFPRIISNPDYQHLEIHRSHDAEENARSQPHQDESIRLRSLWAIEYYFPSHDDGLFAGFARLGWDKEETGALGRNPADWLRKRKETISGGGWSNLGYIARPGPKRFVGPHRTAALPDDVDYAECRIYALTSAVSCIVMMFVVKEEVGGRYEHILRQTYQTEIRPRGRGYEIIGPELQKERAISNARSALRSELRNWFQRNLPGYFSSEESGTEMPVCEFLTLMKAQPFSPRDDDMAQSEPALHVLGIDHDFDAWAYGEVPGLRFSWPIRPAGPKGLYAVIAARRDNFPEDKLEMYGGRDSALPVFLDHRINGLLSRWSLLGVLAGLERKFALRHITSELKASLPRNALKRLNRLGDLFSTATETGLLAAEIERFSDQKISFSHGVAAFSPCRPEYYRTENPSLAGIFRENINRRSKTLVQRASSSQELMMQQTTAVGTRENVRLQRRIMLLTWIIVVLTGLLAWNVFRDLSSSQAKDERQVTEQAEFAAPIWG